MTDWKWYAGANEEEFHSGPFDTRQEAVDALDGEGGYVIEACKRPMDLASFFEIEQFLDYAEQDAYEMANESGDPLFDVPTALAQELQRQIQDTIRRWQAQNNLVFIPWAFSHSRNLEPIHGIDV